ncbi:Thiol:disulfide interchange protein DsbD precursor [Psychrobacter piechaudii]|uniref:Thiol:disulfide interchange protein DsbD n=2 Tax=Psychrobacter piechaudii TaxID=1945521 RepID=A0A1R4GEH8_9GAMM|nr:Thiol:disulfide interchange protein DsbD precursor [Psychrobacter piechaudii]
MTLMKNSVEIKNSPSRSGRKALAASLAISISFGLVSGVGSNPAQAASLADLFGGAETQGGQEKFLKVEQAFSVKPNQNGNKINIALKITPKHYLYKDKLSLKLPEGVTASSIKFSHTSQTIDDPTFGKVDVFKQPQVTATATLTNTTATAINENISISWQGCAEAGLCYPPQTETLAISLPASTASVAGQNKSPEPAATAKPKQVAATNAKPATSENSASTKTDTAAKFQSNLTSPAKQQPQTMATASTVEVGDNEALDEELTAQDTELTDATDTDGENETGLVSDEDMASVEGGDDTTETSLVKQDNGLNSGSSESGLQLGSERVVDQDPFGLAEHPWLALLLLFLAGLGLAFTPCVLPMLPIVSNIVARQHTPTAKKGLILSGSYALGVAIAYGILGAIIAVFGQQLGIIGWLQNPVILLAFATVFVVLALYMLEVVRIPVPNAIRQKTQSLSQAGDKYLGSTFGSFIAGLLSALVVSPCVSAPLFGALLAVSTIGNPLLGFAALFMLGFGLSAPLMLLGASQGNLMPKAGEWMNWVKQGFALLLFAVALLLVERVMVSPIMLMLWAMWFMVVAVWAWKWSGRGQLFTKPLALLLGGWAALTLVGAAAGSKDSWQPLAVFSQPSAALVNANSQTSGSSEAMTGIQSSDKHIYSLDELIPIIEQNPKVLVDVTAEWCVECRIMDKTLFTNRPAAMQQWQLVRLDVTETNEESARILSELSLFGPPALLYFVDGKLQVQQVGTVERPQFEETLNRF